MSEKITKTWLKKQEKTFLADRANRVAMDAVTAVGVNESAKRPDAFRTTGDDWTDNYLVRPSYITSPIELMEDME